MRIRISLALILAAALGAGCERSAAPTEHPDLAGYPVPAGKPDHSYTVRGRVASMPEAGKPATAFQVEHEAIPTFVTKAGKQTGMSRMTMHFPVAKGVPITGLKPGDAIEMDFSVWWDQTPSYVVTAIRPLPAGTKLSFEGEPSKPAQSPPG